MFIENYKFFSRVQVLPTRNEVAAFEEINQNVYVDAMVVRLAIEEESDHILAFPPDSIRQLYDLKTERKLAFYRETVVNVIDLTSKTKPIKRTKTPES